MSFDLITPEQLAELRAIIAGGGSVAACELVAVRWPLAKGTRYYGSAEFNALPVFGAGLTARGITVEARKTSGYFTALKYTDEINDDTVPLELLDHDRDLTAAFQTYGAGHQVEFYVYFPQIDALVSVWWGHLRPPQEGGRVVLSCSASSGFRNAQVPLPRRVLFAGCHSLHGSHFASQEEIDANRGCDWNLHLPGGTRGVAGSELLPPCPGDSRARCTQYLGDDLSFVAADTIVEAIVNKQTKGPALLATSKGNETNLKNSVRVVFGFRTVRELEVSAYTKQFNTNHPDKGFVRVLVPACEGPIKSMKKCAVNEAVIGLEHLNTRDGQLRQPATFFSPSVTNMSGTAHFFAVWGQVDPAGFNASNLRGQADVEGLEDIRVYSDAETYVEQYTTLRAWCLMEMFRNQRWGRGYRDARFVVEDWIALAAWDEEAVSYQTADGASHVVKRSNFNAELVGRPGSQQFSDVCLFGRYGRPFRHNGKVRAVPLRREVIDESIPVFTDEGPDANVVINEEGSQLFWSKIDEAELTNEITLTFEDAGHGNVERPLTFKDQRAQKAAARALGDTGVHVVTKPYSALGITDEGEAIRAGWMLLWLGEFDQGGTRNNLRVRFLTNVFEALNLRRYQLIKVESSKITGFEDPDGNPFVYFRVMDRSRESDLYAWVECQAYSEAVYDEMEGGDIITVPAPIFRLDARNYAFADESEITSLVETGSHGYTVTSYGGGGTVSGPLFEATAPKSIKYGTPDVDTGLRVDNTDPDLSLAGDWTIIFVIKPGSDAPPFAQDIAFHYNVGNGWGISTDCFPEGCNVHITTANGDDTSQYYALDDFLEAGTYYVVSMVREAEVNGGAPQLFIDKVGANFPEVFQPGGAYAVPEELIGTDLALGTGISAIVGVGQNYSQHENPYFAVWDSALSASIRNAVEDSALHYWKGIGSPPPIFEPPPPPGPPGDPALTLGQETVAGPLGPEVTIHGVIEFPTYSKPLRATVYVTPPGGVEDEAGLGEILKPVNSSHATFDYTGQLLGLYTFRVEIETAEDVPVAGGEATENITAAFPEREQAPPAGFDISVTVAGLIDFTITPPASGPAPARYQISRTDDEDPDPADIVYDGPDTTPQEPYAGTLITPVTRYVRAVDGYGNKSAWVEGEYADEPPAGGIAVREDELLRTNSVLGVSAIEVRGGFVTQDGDGVAQISLNKARSQDELIRGLYKAALDRAPTSPEYTAADAALTAANTSGDDYRQAASEIYLDLYTGADYIARGRTDAEFVADLYLGLNRKVAATDGGYLAWLASLATQGGSLSRADLAEVFSVSNEFRTDVVFFVYGWHPEDAGGAAAVNRFALFAFGDDAATDPPDVDTLTNPITYLPAGDIVRARISVDAGTASVEVQTKPFGSGAWTSIGTITISSGTEAEDTTLTGWTLAVTEGHQMRFKLTAVTTAVRVSGSVEIEPA